MAAEPTAQQMAALLTQWNDWLAGRTDAMLSLEDRVRTAGSDKDRGGSGGGIRGPQGGR